MGFFLNFDYWHSCKKISSCKRLIGLEVLDERPFSERFGKVTITSSITGKDTVIQLNRQPRLFHVNDLSGV